MDNMGLEKHSYLMKLKKDKYLDKYVEFTEKFPFLSFSRLYNLILNLKNFLFIYENYHIKYTSYVKSCMSDKYIYFSYNNESDYTDDTNDIDDIIDTIDTIDKIDKDYIDKYKLNYSDYLEYIKKKFEKNNIEILNNLNIIIKNILKIIKFEKNNYNKFIILYIIQNSYNEFCFKYINHTFSDFLNFNTSFKLLYYNYNYNYIYIFLKDIKNDINYDILIEYIENFIDLTKYKYIKYFSFIDTNLYNNKKRCNHIKNTIKILKLYINLVLYIDNTIYTEKMMKYINIFHNYIKNDLEYFISIFGNNNINMTPYIYEKNIMLYKYYINQFDEMLKMIYFHNTLRLRYTFLKMIYIGNYK